MSGVGGRVWRWRAGIVWWRVAAHLVEGGDAFEEESFGGVVDLRRGDGGVRHEQSNGARRLAATGTGRA